MTPGDPYNPSRRPEGASSRRTARRVGEYLVAILGGNILFLIVEPHLPAALQHHTFRVDWGLGLDFALCVILYSVVRFAGQ